MTASLEDTDRSNDNHSPVRDTLDRVGDRWTVDVVRALGDAPKRFNQIKRKLKSISSRMLTMTLKKLERDGIVMRTGTSSNSLRREYRLTSLGITFLAPIGALIEWADHYGPEIEEARARHDSRATESLGTRKHP
jgi:DNA-binding HxlR family transcriptional regulator